MTAKVIMADEEAGLLLGESQQRRPPPQLDGLLRGVKGLRAMLAGAALLSAMAFVASMSAQEERYSTPNPMMSVTRRETGLGLDMEAFERVSQVVLAPAARPDQLVVRFTVEELAQPRETRSCAPPAHEFAAVAWPVAGGAADLVRAKAEHTGCLVSSDTGTFVWHYYVAVLPRLDPGEQYAYEIGHEHGDLRGTFAARFRQPPLEGAKLLVVGDTHGHGEVLRAIESETQDAAALLHLGDLTGITDTGACRDADAAKGRPCASSCSRKELCEGRNRTSDASFRQWTVFFDSFQRLSCHLPVVAAMGAHDNDLQWFFKFRPVHYSSRSGVQDLDVYGKRFSKRARLIKSRLKGQPGPEQQALLNELLAEPHFFSAQVGPVLVISLQSHDNAINPYEVAQASKLKTADARRFEDHFGVASPQYKWLARQLAARDSAGTPWVVVILHTPLLSESDGPACGEPGAEWFLCKFRDLYLPLLEQAGVNAVLAGQARHYARTRPIAFDPHARSVEVGGSLDLATQGAARQDRIVSLVLGTGGAKLDAGFLPAQPWSAFRSDRDFGFGALSADNATHLRWAFHVAPSGAVLDTATLRRYTAPLPPPAAAAAPRADAIYRTDMYLDRDVYAAISQLALTLAGSAHGMRVSFTVEAVVTSPRGPDLGCEEPLDRFTVQYWRRGKQSSLAAAAARHVGCVVSQDTGSYEWHYFVADMVELDAGAEYVYEIGQDHAASPHYLPEERDPDDSSSGVVGGAFRTMPADPAQVRLIVLSDTGWDARQKVRDAVQRVADESALIVHMGDQAYCSNADECRGRDGSQAACSFDCARGSQCFGRRNAEDARFKEWADFMTTMGPLLRRIPMLTTMGNHDNDLQWFFKFRPPGTESALGVPRHALPLAAVDRLSLIAGPFKGRAAVKQAALVNELTQWPLYYSVDVGPFHLVSIQTEDNAVGIHEHATDDGPLTAAEEERFAAHYGPESAQYQWLKADLRGVDRSRTPFVVVFTHRPFFHTSKHHPNCLAGGDWFKCRLREVYVPLLVAHGVSLVLSGHSHHYFRSAPLSLDAAARPVVTANGPTFAVVGTGGASLDKGFTSPAPAWSAFRSDDTHGFATLAPKGQRLAWRFLADDSRVVDSATL